MAQELSFRLQRGFAGVSPRSRALSVRLWQCWVTWQCPATGSIFLFWIYPYTLAWVKALMASIFGGKEWVWSRKCLRHVFPCIPKKQKWFFSSCQRSCTDILNPMQPLGEGTKAGSWFNWSDKLIAGKLLLICRDTCKALWWETEQAGSSSHLFKCAPEPG